MIHEAAEVPTQNVSAVAVDVCVLVHDGCVEGVELRELFVAEGTIERAARPRDGSARNAFRREDAITDLWTNKAQF